MSTAAADLRRSNAFRYPDFTRYQLARVAAVLGAEAQSVGVAWHIYQITHSALYLGYTGLALFLPGVLCVLPAGHAADRYSRKGILLLCYGMQIFCTAVLLWLSLSGSRNITAIFATLVAVGIGRAFSGPASAAILPSLVPEKDFVNAITWGSAFFQVANIMGPACGGILFAIQFHGRASALTGPSVVYVFTLFTLVVFQIFVWPIHPSETKDKRGFSLKTVTAGLHYLFEKRLLLGSISLDLFAVLLGGAVSLMPIFAQDILHAGPRGLGLLRAMPAVGALTMSLTLTRFPLKRHAGKIMLICVAIFGAATIGFGLSHSIPFSLVMLAIIGASDNVSVVVRGSIIQLGTPPEKRGRVSAINWLFLGASNEFGEFESGVTAHWFGAVRAVVYGGVASMMVTGLWAIFFPPLRRLDKLDTSSLLEANSELATSEPVN